MIHSFEYSYKKTGVKSRVIGSDDYLIKIENMPGTVIGEGISFETGEHGRVMSIDEDSVEVILLSRNPIKLGTYASRTGSPLLISAGDGLLGHIINPLGHSLSKKRNKSELPEKRAIEVKPLGIDKRTRITRFLQTGIVINDLLMPLGFGQRELVIGDKQSGKTHYLLQVILMQAKLGFISIYCAIGKRKSEIKAIEEFEKKRLWINA